MATYYVSTTGNNANVGSLASPWATWAFALSAAVLVPGDTVLFRNGIWTEANLAYSKSGTQALPITYKAENNQQATLKSLSTGTNAMIATSGTTSWVTFDGFVFSNDAAKVGTGVVIRGYADVAPTVNGPPTTGAVGLTVKNCLCDTTCRTQCSAGFIIDQDNTLIDNNTVTSIEHNNGSGVIIRNNVIDWYSTSGTFALNLKGRSGQVLNNTINWRGPMGGVAMIVGGFSAISSLWDPIAQFETYDAVIANTTINNLTGDRYTDLITFTGTYNCEVRDTVVTGGGRVQLRQGGSPSTGNQRPYAQLTTLRGTVEIPSLPITTVTAADSLRYRLTDGSPSIVVSTPTTGPTYYIGPSGSDSNSGGVTAPWRTLVYAAQVLRAGDTCIIEDGTYTEDQVVFQNFSGTASQPITLKARNQWGAILSSISTYNKQPAISLYASYIVIQDLRIVVDAGATWDGQYSGSNCAVRAWPQTNPQGPGQTSGYVGAVIRGVLVDASVKRGSGIKVSQDNALVENCTIYSELEDFNNDNAIFRNNVIYTGGPYGTYLIGKGGCRNWQIYNNEVNVNTSNGDINSGILLGGTTIATDLYDTTAKIEAYNCVAYNNVLINTGNSNNGMMSMRGSQNCVFTNNVIIGGGQCMMGTSGNGIPNTNGIWKNNAIKGASGSATNLSAGTYEFNYNDFYNFGSSVPAQTNAITGNPLFVNDTSDWHLQAGSPCSGAGVVVTAPKFGGGNHVINLKRDGTTRTAPWNLGIY